MGVILPMAASAGVGMEAPPVVVVVVATVVERVDKADQTPGTIAILATALAPTIRAASRITRAASIRPTGKSRY